MIEFYNENEMMAYPLSGSTTQQGTDGAALPFSMLADLRMTVPRSLAGQLYVSAFTLTPFIVSVAIASPAGGVFAGTYARPVNPYAPYPLSPMLDMASGYVVFGGGILEQSDFRFMASGAAVSALDIKTTTPVEAAIVMSLGRYLSANDAGLQGVVKLQAGADVTIRYDNGRLKVGLKDTAMLKYVNPCDQQAVFNNCGGPPIRTINGVSPDSNGAITLEVNNA
jgi:hypothetical protein